MCVCVGGGGGGGGEPKDSFKRPDNHDGYIRRRLGVGGKGEVKFDGLYTNQTVDVLYSPQVQLLLLHLVYSLLLTFKEK